MDILSAAILAFVVIETLNIGMLYLRPGSRLGNGLGVFNAYGKADADPATRELVRYLVNWVAGTKLIFVALLVVILVTGSLTTRAYAVVALVLSIVIMFCLHQLQLSQERLVLDCQRYADKRLLRFLVAG